MVPDAALEEPCPCDGEHPFADCCGSAGPGLSRLTATDLAAWARARGIEDQLQVVIDASRTRVSGALPPWARTGITVADLLAPGPYSAFRVDRALFALRPAACAFLL
ncbi:MAG TPA: hypothetical protein VD838_04240, partial [Anaeromyxobacteraceae bacterium]|nr:hypothetical protein [Anaeromyxobacteraceae bacterium]